MNLTPDEREELELLRAEKRDRGNPNVKLLQGRLHLGGNGQYHAVSIETDTGEVYLSELVEELVGWQGKILTFQFHVASQPLSFHALEQELVKTAMGLTTAKFHHAYSDLTGYLWTTEKVDVGGHDLLTEITTMARAVGWPAYIALRIERGL